MNQKANPNYLWCGIILVFFLGACQKDIYDVPLQQEAKTMLSTISFGDFQSELKAIDSDHPSRILYSNEHAKLGQNSRDQFGRLVIFTDQIKKITRDDYTSYTMFVETNDSIASNVYNITFEFTRDGTDYL